MPRSLPYVRIEVNGQEVGTLHLIGTFFENRNTEMMRVIIVSDGIIEGLVSRCEGLLDEISDNGTLHDYEGFPAREGAIRIAETNVDSPASTQTKLEYLKHLAKVMGERIIS